MSDRILMGTRTSDGRSGLFVSRPGADVMTCPASDLLLDPDATTARIVWQQSYSLPAVARPSNTEYLWRINHPDFGFVPYPVIEVTAGFDVMTFGTDVPQPNLSYFIYEAGRTYFMIERERVSGSYLAVDFIVRLMAFADTDPVAYPYVSDYTYAFFDI